MADIESLKAIAELLPPERRERFLLIAHKFRKVSEDDDHLQMLEATGYLTMLVSEIPSELRKLVEEARRPIGESQLARLRAEVVEVLTNSLDTPSYKDLRQTVDSIRECNTRYQQTTSTLHKRMAEFTAASKQGRFHLRGILQGMGGGLITLLTAFTVVYFAFPWIIRRPSFPFALSPFVELYNNGNLNYFEANLESIGDVGVIEIRANVLDAILEREGASVIIRPPRTITEH